MFIILHSLYISELTTAMKGIGLLPDNIKECSYILKEDSKTKLCSTTILLTLIRPLFVI